MTPGQLALAPWWRIMPAVRLLALCLLAIAGGAADIALRAPLTTTWEQTVPPGPATISLTLRVPVGAPADLGAGVFVADRDGRWWQRPLGQVGPGEHRFSIDAATGAALAAEPPPASWSLSRRASRVGIYLWSASTSSVVVQVELTSTPGGAVAAPGRIGSVSPGAARLQVGERYEVTLRPEPLPADPFNDDPQVMLHITAPDGSQRPVEGFLREPMTVHDRGDREDLRAAGPMVVACRFRARMPGVHRLRLSARWASGTSSEVQLPDVVAVGAAATGLARVDPGDPRFFSIDGRFWWPIGLNLHNTYDTRSRDVNATRLTPARGTLTYAAIIDRLAAAGGDATEIWMSNWNLGLAWRQDWPGYQGLNGLNLGNGERLDAVLDHALSRGVRVNLVINNHGQASPKADREWKDSPLNAANGGPCTDPAEVFTNPAALAFQDRIRRYTVARYADHPAIWGWKLWSEVDLTAGKGEPLVRWHEQAAQRWLQLDPSGRSVTTHWAGDYRRVDPAIAALPGIGYLCLDAYRRAKVDLDATPLVDILAGSLHDPTRGLLRFAKPVMVTEYGASSGESPADFRAVDHLIGGWIGLVSGHAAAPMNWWWEWVDQGGRWSPYGAIARFIADEDLRGADASSVALTVSAPEQRLWCRAWIRPGRALGYVLASGWGTRGGDPPRIEGATIQVAEAVDAGRLVVAWWDAERGHVQSQDEIDHPGGPLVLSLPIFHGHLAWKINRR